MKGVFVFFGLLFSAVIISQPIQAQFFKKLADKVAERVEDKLIDDAGDAAVKGVDKSEDAVGEAAKKSAKESKERRKEAAWAKAKVPKESSQVTESNSGKMNPFAGMSGNNKGQSTRPKNYELTLLGNGPDLYMKYQVFMDGAQREAYQYDMHLEMTVSPATGLGRSETVMNIPPIGRMTMASLTDANNPTHIILLNDKKKQYSVLDLSAVAEVDNKSTYTVTRLGEEKLHGLNCVHSKAVDQDGQAFEIWTSTELPGYEKVVGIYSKTQKAGSADLWKKLQEADAAGFLVRMKVQTENGAYTMEMTEVKNIDVPESLFEVPPGYKKKDGGWAKRFMKKR